MDTRTANREASQVGFGVIEERIQLAVDRFYDRVLIDPLLAVK